MKRECAVEGGLHFCFGGCSWVIETTQVQLGRREAEVGHCLEGATRRRLLAVETQN